MSLRALPLVVGAVMNFANLAYAEGDVERALGIWGLARRHPAWSSDDQRDFDITISQWALDPGVVQAGLAKGARLDWEKTIEELIKADDRP